MKLPDGGSTSARTDDEIRRRRAMMTSVYAATTGLGSGPTTTKVLGG